MGVPAFLKQPQVLGLVRGYPLDVRYIAERWLPWEEVASDEFIFNVEVTENPMAPLVTVDAESPRADDELIQQVRASVAYIRYKRSFKESDLRIFSDQAGHAFSALGQMQKESRQKIERYVGKMSAAVDARVEWLRMNALQGSISYDDGSVRVSITFPGVYQPTASPLWSAANATPLTDIGNFIQYIGSNYGGDLKYMIMPRSVLWTLANNTSIQNTWAFTHGSGLAGQMSGTLVAQQIKFLFDIEVIVYDAKYTTRNRGTMDSAPSVGRFLPENKVLFLPDRPIGRTATSPAPPEFSNTGKFAWTKEEIDPWVVEVGAGIHCFPKIEYPGYIVCATVL